MMSTMLQMPGIPAWCWEPSGVLPLGRFWPTSYGWRLKLSRDEDRGSALWLLPYSDRSFDPSENFLRLQLYAGSEVEANEGGEPLAELHFEATMGSVGYRGRFGLVGLKACPSERSTLTLYVTR